MTSHVRWCAIFTRKYTYVWRASLAPLIIFLIGHSLTVVVLEVTWTKVEGLQFWSEGRGRKGKWWSRFQISPPSVAPDLNCPVHKWWLERLKRRGGVGGEGKRPDNGKWWCENGEGWVGRPRYLVNIEFNWSFGDTIDKTWPCVPMSILLLMMFLMLYNEVERERGWTFDSITKEHAVSPRNGRP